MLTSIISSLKLLRVIGTNALRFTWGLFTLPICWPLLALVELMSVKFMVNLCILLLVLGIVVQLVLLDGFTWLLQLGKSPDDARLFWNCCNRKLAPLRGDLARIICGFDLSISSRIDGATYVKPCRLCYSNYEINKLQTNDR